RRTLLRHNIHTEAVKLAKFKASIHRYACQIWSSDQTAKLRPHFLRDQSYSISFVLDQRGSSTAHLTPKEFQDASKFRKLSEHHEYRTCPRLVGGRSSG